MASRLELHELLCEMLGSRNVYYQPPESIKMKYPAIVYSRSRIPVRHADNDPYLIDHAYQVTLIDWNPDNPLVDEFARLHRCSFDRHFTHDNLNHDVFTLYY